jgi:hypothetical protein
MTAETWGRDWAFSVPEPLAGVRVVRYTSDLTFFVFPGGLFVVSMKKLLRDFSFRRGGGGPRRSTLLLPQLEDPSREWVPPFPKELKMLTSRRRREKDPAVLPPDLLPGPAPASEFSASPKAPVEISPSSTQADPDWRLPDTLLERSRRLAEDEEESEDSLKEELFSEQVQERRRKGTEGSGPSSGADGRVPSESELV